MCRSAEPGNKWGFHTDHDHVSGETRNIICHPCNLALGGLKDSPVNSAAALVYLAAHGKALTTEQLAEFLSVYDRLIHDPTD
jgi:hypothetical protein